MTTMSAITIMISAGMSLAVIVVGTHNIRVIGQLSCRKGLYGFVRVACNAPVNGYSRLGKSGFCSASHTSTDKRVNALFFEKTSKRTVPRSV